MEQPSAWVVGQESQCKPPVSRQHGDVSSDRVIIVQPLPIIIGPSARARSQHVEIMPVKMDRMGDLDIKWSASSLRDDPVSPDILCWQRNDIGADCKVCDFFPYRLGRWIGPIQVLSQLKSASYYFT